MYTSIAHSRVQEQLIWSEMPTISSDRHGDGETAEQFTLNGVDATTIHEDVHDDKSVDISSHIGGSQAIEGEEQAEDEAEEIEETDEFDDFDDFAEGAEHDDDAFGDFDAVSGEAFDTAIPESIAETPSIKPSLYQPVSSSLPVVLTKSIDVLNLCIH